MHDPALKQKAQDLFVIDGFTMSTIQSMLPDVSRKTLYNWRKKDKWADKRRAQVVQIQDRRESLEQSIDDLIKEFRVTHDPKLIFAIGKAAAALKTMNTFKFTEEKKAEDSEESKKQGFSEENLKKIEKEIFGL